MPNSIKRRTETYGNLAILKDKLRGTETRYVYDLADRLVRVEDSAGLTATYEYFCDNAGTRPNEGFSKNDVIKIYPNVRYDGDALK
ncbi:MAG: hypothetical protein IJF24_03615 [Clostridia bacterium]|nr:hypothetical protein [Clostridia bacterium]